MDVPKYFHEMREVGLNIEQQKSYSYDVNLLKDVKLRNDGFFLDNCTRKLYCIQYILAIFNAFYKRFNFDNLKTA